MRISILINNFNYGRFLDDCLLSLQNQTVKPDEVILYDDGSSDNSLEIASKYSFVRIISQPNFGHKPSFNQANAISSAFMESTGDIICLLDSDDFFRSDKIEHIKNAFLLNPSAVLVQHSYYLYQDGKIKGKGNNALIDENYKRLYQKKQWTGFFNPTSNLCFLRSYLDEVLPIQIDPFWRVWPDVRMSRLAPFSGDIICLEEPLVYYRRHGSNDSSFMNKDHEHTFRNQIDHHNYINTQLRLKGISPIKYKRSLSYWKFFVKAIIFSRLVGKTFLK